MNKSIPYVLLVLLFAGAAWYSLTRTPEPVDELPPPQLAPALPDTQAPPPQADTGRLYPQPAAEMETPPEPLPALNESDPEVTGALVDIAGAGPLAEYVVMDQVISRVVASIDSLTSRQVPVNINPIKPAGDKFVVDSEGEKLVLSPQNYARYDGYVTLLREMDTGSLVTFYRHYYPLFQQAWEENGGQGSFNDRLLEVIDSLLAAPDLPGPIYLVKPEAVYLFEDPELEALKAGQKVLVRMGNANAEVVKQKLAEIRAQLNPQT